MKKILIVLTLLWASTTLSACNTMQGFGQDLQKVGEKITSGAERKKAK